MQITTDPIETLDQKTFPLNRYKPIEKLGHGECGRAFLCFDQFIEQDVVVKTMGAVELDQLIDFQRDATILCRLSNRGLAQVLDFGCTTSGATYIVSEYHPGINLSSHIKEGELLPIDLAIKTFAVIAEALTAMHEQGVLHRDVKTSNILVRNLDTTDCAIYLLDAGTGRIKNATMQPNILDGRSIPGDPLYMSPEFAQRLNYDARSEIFALGCAMFETLTGRTPFDGAKALDNLSRSSAPSLNQLAKGVSFPYKLESFIGKCLSRSPETRYQTMLEVSQSLRTLAKLQLKVEPLLDFAEYSPTEVDSPSAQSQKKNNRSGKNGQTVVVDRNDQDPAIRLVNTDGIEFSDSNNPANVTLFAEEESSNGVSVSLARKAVKKAATNQSVFQTTNPATITGTPPAVASDGASFRQNRQDLFKQILQSSIVWLKTSPYRPLVGALAIMLAAATMISYSYYTYLSAPSIDIEGTVLGYQPATGATPGWLEIEHLDRLGTATTDKIIIETDEQNLPQREAVPMLMNDSDSDLANQEIFANGEINLDHLKLSVPTKELKSDLMLGQKWELECRKQWDGSLVVEKLVSGAVPYGQEQLEDIHLVLSKMVYSLAHQPVGAELEADSSWSVDSFESDVPLEAKPPGLPPEPQVFPAADLKLRKLSSIDCVMMMKAPAWMSPSTKYLNIRLVNTTNSSKANWRVDLIEPCTEGDWNRR